MDITAEFRERVRAVRRRLGPAQGPHSSDSGGGRESKAASAQARAFGEGCAEVRAGITRVREVVEGALVGYCHVAHHLRVRRRGMSEAERDEVDAVVSTGLAQCHTNLARLKAHVAACAEAVHVGEGGPSAECVRHWGGQVESINGYLQQVSALHARLGRVRMAQAARRRWAVDVAARQHDPLPRAVHSLGGFETALTAMAGTMLEGATGDDGGSSGGGGGDGGESGAVMASAAGEKQRRAQLAALEDEVREQLQRVKPQVLEGFAQENQTLVRQIRSLSADMAQAESKVTEIARLHRVLAEKVSAQADNIEHILATAVETTETIARGNVHLREAREYNRRFRWMVFLILLFCAVSLLVFDWATR